MSKLPPLDPSISQNLTLASFQVSTKLLRLTCNLTTNVPQGKFDVTDFIGTISEKLIAQSKAVNGRTCALCAPSTPNDT